MSRQLKAKRFEQILSLIHKGIVRTGEIADQVHLSWKQTSRLLEAMVSEGLLQKPVRGVYYSSQARVVSMEDFNSLHNSQSVLDEMSKNIKQETSRYTPKGVLLAWKEKNLSTCGHRPEEMDREGTFDSPQTVVHRILEVCRIERYTLEDERYCVHVLGDVWREFTTENIEAITAQAMMRFATEGRAPSRNSLAYLCGIARRIVLASRDRVMRNYRQFLRDYPMLAVAGMEEAAVAVENGVGEEVGQYEMEGAASVESDDDGVAVDDEPRDEWTPEWVAVGDKLLEMATKLSAFTMTSQTIRRVVHGLQKRGGQAGPVLEAMEYMDRNNPKGKVYFVNHLNNDSLVDKAIRTNYQWYMTYGMDGPDTKETSSVSKKDERYSAFYELFPDA